MLLPAFGLCIISPVLANQNSLASALSFKSFSKKSKPSG